MKRYEYKLLEDCATKSYGLKDINELAKDGWRVVYTILTDGYYEKTLMEREIENDQK